MDLSRLIKALGFGIIGSLVAGLLMDVVMFIEFALAGLPIATNFELMGSVFGGGTSLGIFVHIITLVVLGSVFTLAVLFVKSLRIETVSKGIALGLLFGIVTIPGGCVPFALLSGTPVVELLTLSTIPHIVWGAALGLVSGYKLNYSALSGKGGE